MVGKTKLIRTTGSPLIGGMTRSSGVPVYARILIAVGALAVIGAGVWFLFLR